MAQSMRGGAHDEDVNMTEGLPAAITEEPPSAKLGILERFMTLWILAGICAGVLLAVFVPAVGQMISSMQWGNTNLFIAAGLIVMMYPPLAAVEYGASFGIFRDWRFLAIAMVANWIVAPLVMFAIGLLMLRDSEYIQGLILIGISPCIAMVLLWNDLAKGHRDNCANLVAINSIVSIVLYSPYAALLITVLMPLCGVRSITRLQISIWSIAQSVMVYLGIPLLAAIVGRKLITHWRSRHFYDHVVLPLIHPIAFLALLFTIVVMFSLKGDMFLQIPMDVLLISLPLVVYFLFMFLVTFGITWLIGLDYERCTTLAFTAGSNNFELAIAVAISVFGVNSKQAFAAAVGPLIEVPIMLALVQLSLLFRDKAFSTDIGQSVELAGVRV